MKKIQRNGSSNGLLSKLKTVQRNIEEWYQKDCEKIKLQAKLREMSEPERVRIYHHEIHQTKIKSPQF